MAAIFTRGMSIVPYLTGESSDAGSSATANTSLGKFRSSVIAQSLSIDYTGLSAAWGAAVFYASGNNGAGTGTIRAVTSSSVAYTAPGGTEGPAVSCSSGQHYVLEDGADPSKWVWFFAGTTINFTGSQTFALSITKNNVFGFDDVSSAERVAGDVGYRCFCLRNASGNQVTNIKVRLKKLGTRQTTDAAQLGASGSGSIQTSGSFADWPAVGYARILTSGAVEREIVYYSSRTSTVLTIPAAGRALLGTTAAAGASDDTVDAIPGIAIGLDAPTSQPSGSFVDNTGSGEGTAPSGVTFSSPTETAEALEIGTLADTYIYGVWIKRQIPAGATSQADWQGGVIWDYDGI